MASSVDCLSGCGPSVVLSPELSDPVPGPGSDCLSPVRVEVCSPTTFSPRRVVPRGVNIASGSASALFDPLGNGSSVSVVAGVGVRVQSVTVTGFAGSSIPGGDYVRVTLYGAEQFFLLSGMSFTWSVSQDAGGFAEYISDGDVVVECFGDSAAGVIWTEEMP